MARLYSNENLPLQVVDQLRALGHDVLTSLEAGNANRRVPDLEVLEFAANEARTLVTQNRLHFIRLHRSGAVPHHGIIVCTFDPDFAGQAGRIHAAISSSSILKGQLIRVNRL